MTVSPPTAAGTTDAHESGRPGRLSMLRRWNRRPGRARNQSAPAAASGAAPSPTAVPVGALPSGDAGMSTVEYAVGTVVAAAFAAVLYKIVTGDSVVAGLTNLVESALSSTF